MLWAGSYFLQPIYTILDKKVSIKMRKFSDDANFLKIEEVKDKTRNSFSIKKMNYFLAPLVAETGQGAGMGSNRLNRSGERKCSEAF